MTVLFLILLALCSYGVWEYAVHQKRLKRIPIRIHVNGSRGKSSVTRLIVAGLRAGGIRTVGKTTGTLPRILNPDGSEITILRDQSANISEQIKILKYIERFNPEALVIECMAVLPEYQWICERQMVKSSVGVITNCRLDHTNEMGRFREQITHSLANTCPSNSILFTSEKSNLHVLKEIADSLGTEIRRVGGQGVTIDELRRFGHIEHPANVGLSLAVCEWAGVDRETALKGMYKVIPDAGALRIALCHSQGKELLFVNALAANDPESTLEIWHQIKAGKRWHPLGKVIILLNSRADRQDRSVHLIEMVAGNIDYDYFVLIGEKTPKFLAYLAANKVPKEKAVGLGRLRHEKTYNKLFDLIDEKGTVLAIGNAGAGGLDLFKYFFKKRLFPLKVSCPNCSESLMDHSYQIDGSPSILVDIAAGDKRGWLRLSSLYGSFNIELEIDIPNDEVVKLHCPHCGDEMIGKVNCSECDTPMVSMVVRGGGEAFICPRRGCRGHLLEDVNAENNELIENP